MGGGATDRSGGWFPANHLLLSLHRPRQVNYVWVRLCLCGQCSDWHAHGAGTGTRTGTGTGVEAGRAAATTIAFGQSTGGGDWVSSQGHLNIQMTFRGRCLLRFKHMTVIYCFIARRRTQKLLK